MPWKHARNDDKLTLSTKFSLDVESFIWNYSVIKVLMFVNNALWKLSLVFASTQKAVKQSCLRYSFCKLMSLTK